MRKRMDNLRIFELGGVLQMKTMLLFMYRYTWFSSEQAQKLEMVLCDMWGMIHFRQSWRLGFSQFGL